MCEYSFYIMLSLIFFVNLCYAVMMYYNKNVCMPTLVSAARTTQWMPGRLLSSCASLGG